MPPWDYRNRPSASIGSTPAAASAFRLPAGGGCSHACSGCASQVVTTEVELLNRRVLLLVLENASVDELAAFLWSLLGRLPTRPVNT